MRIRVVLDANIFASALMNPSGTPATVLRSILEKKNYELVLSQPILEELQRILYYPKVRKRIKQSDQEILMFLHALSISGHLVQQRHAYEVLVTEDPDDDIYLIAALEGWAHYLVSGDQHLLKLQKFEHIKIISASEFLSILF